MGVISLSFHVFLFFVALTVTVDGFACRGPVAGPEARCISIELAAPQIDIDRIRAEMMGQSAPVSEFSDMVDASFEEMDVNVALLHEICGDRGGRIYEENGEQRIYCEDEDSGSEETEEVPEETGTVSESRVDQNEPPGVVDTGGEGAATSDSGDSGQATEQVSSGGDSGETTATDEPADEGEPVVVAEEEVTEEEHTAGQETSEIRQECDEKLKTLIDEFLSDKSRNIVGKQFHLTNLKLSQMVLEAKKENRYIETLEDLTRAKSQELQQVDPNGEVRAKMVHFYRMSESGRSQDQQIANTYKEKISQAKYWHRETRLFNNHTSAFAYAYSQKNNSSGDQSDLNELDAAALWLMDKVQRAGEENGLTGGQSNLLNSSTQVAFMTGAVENDYLNKSEEEIENSIDETQSEINQTLEGLYAEAERELQQCVTESGMYLGSQGGCFNAPQLVRESYLNNVMNVANQINREDIKIDGKEVELGDGDSSFQFSLD